MTASDSDLTAALKPLIDQVKRELRADLAEALKVLANNQVRPAEQVECAVKARASPSSTIGRTRS